MKNNTGGEANVFSGRLLEVDLTTGRMEVKKLSDEERCHYPGGLGLNARLLASGQKSGVDPLGPENQLVFGVGSLVGTNVVAASRTEVSAKSPLTGLFGTANSGYYWGGALKYAGFDALVLRGKASVPVYLWIDGGRVEIREAEHLWGLDTWQALRQIRRELDDDGVQAALIGPAGEKLVRFASLQNGPYDAWGRTGMGAVMGSKLVKAVAVRGRQGLRPARAREFLETAGLVRQVVTSSPFYGPFKRFGTMLASGPYGAFGSLPGRNFQTGWLEGWEESCSRSQVPRYSRRGIACMACPLACAHWTEIGPDFALKDMEVTPVLCFGAGLDIKNIPALARLSAFCQRSGLDMVAAASVAAFATELFTRGIISREDVGFELSWGSEEKVLKLLELVVRRHGIGDILAEGVRLASLNIPGAYGYAMEIKGLELPIADPRGRWSTWTFGYLTNTRGGDHLRTRNPVENLRFNDNPAPYLTERFGFGEEMLAGLDMPDEIKRDIFSRDTLDVHIPRMAKWAEDLIALFNCLGVCIRPPLLHTLGPTLFARLYAAATGLDLTPAEMMACGERAWNLQKIFNLREGEQPEESAFPERFYQEPLPEGPGKGRVLDRMMVEEALREYYTRRGWDPGTGKPGKEKLKELGLAEEQL